MAKRQAEKTLVTDKIVKWLRDHGAMVQKNHGTRFTRRGMPDIIACHTGRTVVIECKRPGKLGSITLAQCRQLEAWGKAGALAFACDNFEAFLLRQYDVVDFNHILEWHGPEIQSRIEAGRVEKII